MDKIMMKMDQSIHAIRVGCDNCNGPHLMKDCNLDANGNRKAQVHYSSGEKYYEDWRQPKMERLPRDKYMKQKE